MYRLLCALALASAGVLSPAVISTAAAQSRPPGFRPPPTVVTPVRPAPAPAPQRLVGPNTQYRPTPPTPVVNGNSINSNKPQLRYGIYRNDTQGGGRITTWKYGVSGGTTRAGDRMPQPRLILSPSRDYADRAIRQVNKLNADPVQTDGGRYRFTTRVLERVPPQPPGQPTSRQLILSGEKQAVTKFDRKTGGPPAGNIRPAPLPKK